MKKYKIKKYSGFTFVKCNLLKIIHLDNSLTKFNAN